MTRYADESASLVKAVEKAVKEASFRDKKFFPVIAKDHQITDDLNNPIACLLCCKYGIAIFDSVEKKLPTFNPNIAYELGMQHLLKRECLILKSLKIKTMPSDILSKLYEPFDSTDNAKEKVQAWLKSLVQ